MSVFFPTEENIELLLLISHSTDFTDLRQRLGYKVVLYFVHQRVNAVNCITLGAVHFKRDLSDPTHREEYYAGDEE